MLKDFLSKLGASTKITVGVSVSPGVGLEMIEVDRATGTIVKYGNKPLDYNYSSREITDYDQFAGALSELFEDLEISSSSNIILSIPNIHFGMIKLPILLTDDAITNAIISEVEQSYIFKRQEPVVGWHEIFSNPDTENRTLVYTAIQENALNEIIEKCREVGCTLAGVEISYASLLKALHFSEVTKEQMKENVTWNLMLIGQNSYSIISMVDKKIMEYYEEPLALKSFVDDEIYNAITTSSQVTLSSLPANHLFIVSETDLVSAEILSLKIEAGGTVKFLECNKFAQSELIPVSLDVLPNLALQITPEAIGAAIYPFSDFPLKLNVISGSDDLLSTEDSSTCPKMNIGNLEIELTPAFIKRVALLVSGIIILPIFILNLVLSQFLIPREQTQLDTLSAKISTTSLTIEKYGAAAKTNTFDSKYSINKIVEQNKLKLNYYDALGISVPKRLWVTYYILVDSGKIDLKGKADNVQSVYDFYKDIKQMINNSDVRLYKLEIDSGLIDDVVADIPSSSKTYNFEITNMAEAELNPPPPTGTDGKSPTTADGTTQQPNSTEQKNVFQIGKPLFQLGKPSSEQTPSDGRVPPAIPNNLERIEKF